MRNKSIDMFRGLIMIIMAIDHVSYFILDIHFYEGFDAIYTQHTSLSFLTRFITHICAPGFFFAMGYGAYHKYHKLDHFNITLLLRGCFLMLVQITLVNWIWDLEVGYYGVIFALGATMILLNLTMPLMGYGYLITLMAVFVTQVIVTGPTDNMIIRFLVKPGMVGNDYLLYVILPWYGVSAFGAYVASREKFPYRWAGLLCLGTFFLVRGFNAFGNTHQYTAGWISFFNVTKYPPSLAFLLLTMGLNFILIDLLSHVDFKWLITFGKAPLLFYISHLALYRGISELYQTDAYSLLYLIWLISLIPLYFICFYLNKQAWFKWSYSLRNRLHKS